MGKGKIGDFYTPEEDLARLQKAKNVVGIDSMTEIPKVLIIGDSISIGYTPYVMQKMAGKVSVSRPKNADGSIINCGSTKAGVAKVKNWIGDEYWDVIHFNFGLHDIAYRHPDSEEQGNRDKVNGSLSVTPLEYLENIEYIVKALKETRAELIWASTTVVPPGEAGRFEGDEIKYNAIAAEVMLKYGIHINDLHTVSSNLGTEMFIGPGNVHYTAIGSEILAGHVVNAIAKVLNIHS